MGRMRGATCFLFKIFQTNRLLPLPCFPLWGKCLRKQTIEVNFNFLTLIQLFPSKQVCTNNQKKSIQLFFSPKNANNTNLEKSGFVLFFAMFKHPPKFHLKFFKNSTSANSIAVEKFRNLCYNNKQARQVCQNA